MRSHSGVAARMFDALVSAKIPIENVSTSEIVVSAVEGRESGKRMARPQCMGHFR